MTNAGLTLQQWLDANEMTYYELARLIPCSLGYPRMLAQGIARPSYEMARRIEVVTHGGVPRTIWYPPEDESETNQIEPIEDFEL